MRLSDLADRVRTAPARLGSTRLVLVDGPAGSGKTTLAGRLAAALGGAPVVHMDDLYDGWTLDGAVDRLTAWVLDPVAAGRDAVFDGYDWAAGAFGLPTVVPTGSVLVVEGCGCSARALDDRVSLRIWVEAPPEVCARRWVARGGAAMAAFQPDWARAEAAEFTREDTRARADVRVDGAPADDPGPDGVAVLP